LKSFEHVQHGITKAISILLRYLKSWLVMLATIFHMSSGFSKIERVLSWQSSNFHFENVNKISKVRLFEASGKHLKIICDFDSTKSRHAPEIGQTGHRQEMVMFPLKIVETHHF